MNARENLQQCVSELQNHPFAGLAGFAVGLLFSVSASLLDRFATRQESAMYVANGTENFPSFLAGILGAAALLFILVQIAARKQRRALFVICILLGAVSGFLVYVIATGLARYHF